MPGATPQGWIAIYDLLRHLFDQIHHNPDWVDLPPPCGWETWEALFPLDAPRRAAGEAYCETPNQPAVRALLDALAVSLATGTIPSAAVDCDTGELTMLRPACWRLLRFDEEKQEYLGTIVRAWLGSPVQYHDQANRERLCHPLLAERDIARFFGVEELPDLPPETPPGWPGRMRSMPDLQRAELVRIFVQGYAAATLHAAGKAVPQRDDHMEAACKIAVPGCTQAEVWKAYSALPRELRNPSPEERRAERGSAA